MALVVAAGGGLVACSLLVSLDGLNGGGQQASGPGSIGQACFPNGTCDEGLTCLSNVCVSLTGDGGSSDGASGDGATGGDGSIGNDSGPSALACGSALLTGSAGSSAGVISAPHIAAYNPSGAFTIEAWVYPTAYPSAGLATIAAHETPSNSSWTLGMTHTGVLTFVFSKDGNSSTTAAFTNGTTLPLNSWSHVVGEFDGVGNLAIWQDGLANVSASTGATAVNAVTAPLTIGNASDGDAPFTGRIEEVRLSAGALYPASFEPDARLSSSPTTLALFHLDDGTKVARDASTHANDASVLNDASLIDDCAPDVCSWVHLTGGTINVSVPSGSTALSPPNSFTLEGWFRTIEQGTAVNGGGYEIYQNTGAGGVSFFFACSGGTSTNYFTPPYNGPSSVNIWHHWAAEFDSGTQTVSLYVDGALIGTEGEACTATETTTGLTFGNGQYDISEVRLSSSVRYGVTFAPEKVAIRFTTDSSTLALYHFDEASGTIAHDSSGNDAGLDGVLSGSPLPTFAQCQ
jgi:hypothetical protein